jgi:hypothetical protein
MESDRLQPTTEQRSSGARAVPGLFARVIKYCLLALLWGLVALLTLWAAAALYFDVRVPWLRLPLAAIYGLSMVAALIWVRPARRAAALGGVGFVLVLAWWLSLKPSNDRDWQPDVAVLPYATFTGNQVTIHDIRNCNYRTETDYDTHCYDKAFNLDDLRTVDLYLVTWGSPHIAHTMVSFGFAGGDHLCFSIETRKEKGEGYSAVKGLFRQFELTYVIADERDLVRLRTNYRQGEEVYLYPLRLNPEQGRTLFLDYLKRANALRQRPQWYNAVTDNCTTAIRTQRAAEDRQAWDWRLLINGHLDELLYERGLLPTNLPFAALKKQCWINARARAADQDPDFSKRIRQNLP